MAGSGRFVHQRTSANLPHALVCPVLRSFGSFKYGNEDESVLRMALDALALEYLEVLAVGASSQQHPSAQEEAHAQGAIAPQSATSS